MELKSYSNTIKDNVYNILRKNILDLNLKPGEEINIKEISEKFEISRSPVRDAINRLGEEGLVDIIPQKGTKVSKIDLKRVQEERFIRETLESGVLSEFVLYSKKENFIELELKIEEQKIHLKNKDYSSFIDADDEFHQVFFKALDKKLCIEVLKNYLGHYRRIRVISIWSDLIAEEIIFQHIQMSEAAKNKDIEILKKYLKNHCKRLVTDEKFTLEKYPEYFKSYNDISIKNNMLFKHF